MKLLIIIGNEIIELIIIILLIIAFAGYAVAVTPEPIKNDMSTACEFPCFQDQYAYRLPVESVKERTLKTIY